MKVINLKRFLSLLLALALTVSMLPASAVAAEAADGEPVVAGETGEESPAEGDASGSTAEPEEEPASDGTDEPTGDTSEGDAEDPTGDPVDEAPSAADEVQALIDALPDADAITADNAADVAAQLTAIDEAEDALTDEEFATLDTSRYDAAVTALEALEGTEDPEPAAEETGTLQSLIDSAASGGTVTLTGNVTEDITISNGQNIILDLNGKTLKNTAGSNTITVASGATLTITDSSTGGTVDNVTHLKCALYVASGGTCTFNLTLKKTKNLYVVGYLIYQKEDGEEVTVYTSVYKSEVVS